MAPGETVRIQVIQVESVLPYVHTDQKDYRDEEPRAAISIPTDTAPEL